MKIWIKIKNEFIIALGVVSAIVTIITGYPKTEDILKGKLMQFSSWCGNNYDIVIKCFFYFSLMTLIAIIVWYLLLVVRKLCGTHWIPVSFKVLCKCLCRKKKKNKEFETAIRKFSEEATKSNMKKNNFRNVLVDFLESVGIKLKERYNVDFSVSYKSFIGGENGDFYLLPDASYCAYQPKEHLYRYSEFVYSLNSREKKGKISDYICTAQEENKPDGTRSRKIGNNIFIYLFRNNQTEYMTNDLEKEEKEGNFFTGSLNYPLFYESMAVFSIEKKNPNTLLGFLVIDSPQKGVFIEKEFHKIGELLKESIIKIYDKYEE